MLVPLQKQREVYAFLQRHKSSQGAGKITAPILWALAVSSGLRLVLIRNSPADMIYQRIWDVGSISVRTHKKGTSAGTQPHKMGQAQMAAVC